MKGDFSRDSYRPAAQYSRVLMQLGRAQLDADWNEQTSILLGYMRALTRDLFGSAAGPAAECGFQIVTAENRASLSKETAAVVDAAVKAGAKLDDTDMLILPGRYYVGGLPVEAVRVESYASQAGVLADPGKPLPFNEKTWLAYLDVWEDFVSADQDEQMAEVALGGVDTCGRARIMWQVRVLFGAKDREALVDPGRTGTGRIKVRAEPTKDLDELCSINPDARYRGAENQLYRIEVHVGGKADPKGLGATFKWSRDNGATTFPIVLSKGGQMTLAHLGRDETRTLVEGDWVELVDDGAVAGAGRLAQVTKVNRDDRRIELALPEPGTAWPTYLTEDAEKVHALIRRWEHKGDLKKAGGAIPITEGSEIDLEDGVKIQFEAGGDYRAGDYWLAPARIATGDVEWPGPVGQPEFQLPAGPKHFYAPLAFRGPPPAGGAAVVTDLRCRIERLPCLDKVARNN